MRLSADYLIFQAPQRINPLQERELDLRGIGLVALEHMAATRDAFDTWDLSNNRLMRLENLPRLHRLRHLHCAGNVVESVHVNNLVKNVPNVETLILSYNKFTSLVEVKRLSLAFPKLQYLSLVGNPVVHKQHYRSFAITAFPKLQVLDFCKVTLSARRAAQQWIESESGKELQQQLEREQPSLPGNDDSLSSSTPLTTIKEFVPGEGGSFGQEENHPQAATIQKLTAEQKSMIRELIANAASVHQVEDIERAVRQGRLAELESLYAANSFNNKRTALTASLTTAVASEIGSSEDVSGNELNEIQNTTNNDDSPAAKRLRIS